MIYQLANIVRDVRVALDEDRTGTALLAGGDIDVLKLDDIIRSKILESIERVETAAPYHLLDLGHNFQYDLDGVDNDNNGVVDNEPRAIFWEGSADTCGWLVLPDDFMRLVVFQMSDWERPVYDALAVTDPDYLKQRSRVKGIRGCVQRPVVAIAIRPEGKVLEFYSCNDRTATVSKAVYIPYPSVDEYGGVEVSERCYRAVVYTAAALTLVSCGESDKAKGYFELAVLQP